MKNTGTRINGEITAPNVRVVSSESVQLGIMTLEDALAKAESEGLDLVEIAPKANPPVCKITDWGKELYRRKKQEQAAKSKQHVIQIKEIQLRPVTDNHDLEIKLKRAQEFLRKGNKVKFLMKFHGREISHAENGVSIMESFVEKLSNTQVEKPPMRAGNNIIMIVAPISKND